METFQKEKSRNYFERGKIVLFGNDACRGKIVGVYEETPP